MPVYHVVLFRTKPGVKQDSLQEFTKRANAMVSQIPGLLKINVGPPLAVTAHRSKGFDMGLVAVLEKQEDLAVYATHPAHLHAQELREEICEDSLAYDMEFPG
ncbi:hypothetical protein F4804DRAFT_317751 [Jackrogersella minutella]|nr:hypothetical protein F4804DRAFT_317751 [Jackrogersella minutella]